MQEVGHGVAVALAVLDLAFGTVLKIFVNNDLHPPFAPRSLRHKFIGNYSNYNSVKKFQISCSINRPFLQLDVD